MRLFYFILLLLFVGVVAWFAYQNKDPVTIKYLDKERSFPLPAVVAATYVLGMFSGWTVVGMLKRSIRRVTERRE